MNLLYFLNYLILATFLALFFIELGVSMLILGNTNIRKKLLEFINPLWEVNGTFAIFYVVNLEASFPLLIPAIASLYEAPLLIGIIMLLLRNAFIVYSEYVASDSDSSVYSKVYAVATLAIGAIAVSVLTSFIWGIGINSSTMTVDLFYIVFNPFNVTIAALVLLIILQLTSKMFAENIKFITNTYSIFVSFSLLAATIYLYSTAIFPVQLMLAWYVVSVISLIVYFAYLSKRETLRIKAGIANTLFIIFLFSMLTYPNAIGGKLDLNAYSAAPSMALAIELISICGAAFLAFALYYFVRINYSKSY